MTNQQIMQATRFQEEGHSLREIAEKLGVSKSAVDRALKEETTLTDALNPTIATVTPMRRTDTPESIELGKLDLELTHERKMTELKIRQDELALQRRQVELEAERIDNEKKMLQLREKHLEHDQKGEEERVGLQKEMLLTRFNRLVREVLNNCVESTWSEGEVDDFLERSKALRNRVSRFCDGQTIDEDELAIHHYLKSLIKLIEQTKENHTHFFGSDVEVDFDKKQIKAIKTWLINDFEKVYQKPATKKGADEDDEDDNDDEEVNSFEQEKELLATFDELLSELVDNCKNSVWTVSEYDDYQERIHTFQTELLEYTDEIGSRFDADQQAIAVNTSALLEFVTARRAVVAADKDTLTLHVNEEEAEILTDLRVDDFWELVE